MTHVLVIDDDRQSISVLAELFKVYGISYTSSYDATKVETLVKNLSEPVDMVLLDLEMPLVNGYQILEMLQGLPDFQNVPIVACTVHTNQKVAAQSAGFHSFITKPIDIDRFGDQLQSILNDEPVWDY